jgi:head-tail adaptor
MPRFRAGQLDRRLTIERRERARDPSTGELIETWVIMGQIWAEKLTERGIQRYAAQQLLNEVETGWSMRWDPGLLDMTPDGHRVSENEHHFTVVQLVEIPRRQGIVVLGKARAEGLTVDGQVPEQ